MKVILFNIAIALISISSTAQSISWEQIYEDDSFAYANSIEDILPLDNGYLLVGSAHYGNATNLRFIHLIRTNEEGEALWQKYLNKNDQFPSTWQTAHTILPADDGNFLIGGTKDWFWENDTLYLLKVNLQGDTLWSNQFIGSHTRTLSNRMIRVGESLYFVGSAYDTTLVSTLLLGTNQEGTPLWSTSFLPSETSSEGLDLIGTSDGGFALTGVYNDDVLLLKTDQNGNLEWQIAFPNDGLNKGFRILENEDGFLIGGGSVLLADTLHPLLIQTDGSGNLLWQKIFTNIEGFITGLHLKDDGNYASTTSHDGFYNDYFGGPGFFLTINPSGNLLHQLPLLGNGIDIEKTNNGGYLTAGSVFGEFSANSYLTKVDGIINNTTWQKESPNDFRVYPNPSTGRTLFVEVKSNHPSSTNFDLKNAAGKTILKGALTPGINSLSTDGLANGNYFLTVKQQGKEPIIGYPVVIQQ